jgi:hypothetical protein
MGRARFSVTIRHVMTIGRSWIAVACALTLVLSGSGCDPTDLGPGPLSPQGAGCLIARYPLAGDGRDTGPNHLDGNVYGTGSSGPDPCGRPGSAYVFNGADSFVSLGASPALKPTRVISVEVWIKPATFAPTYQNIVSDHAPNETTAGYAFILRFAKGDLQFLVGGVYGLGTAAYADVDMSRAGLGVWHHVAGVYDGSSIRLYVDGVLQNAVPYGQTMRQNENAMRVGKSGFGEFFKGSISDLRIYGCALDGDAVASSYASGRCS